MTGRKWLRLSACMGALALVSTPAISATISYTDTLPAVSVPLGGTMSSTIPITPFDPSLGTLESTDVSISTTFIYGGSVTVNSPVLTSGLIQLTGTTATYNLANGLPSITSASAAFANCPCSPTTFGDSGSVTKTGSAVGTAPVSPSTSQDIGYNFTFSKVASAPFTVNITNSIGATATVTDTYTPTVRISPQEVWLDFNNDPNANYKGYSYNKPSAESVGLGFNFASDADAITAEVQNIYRSYNIKFTDTKPISGSYDTVYIGGAPSQLPALNLPSDLIGQSQAINIGNKLNNLAAIIPTEIDYYSPAGFEQFQCTLSQGKICDTDPESRLAQVIAHETGHLVGLVHVVNDTQLMYRAGDILLSSTTGYGDPTAIGPSAYVAAGVDEDSSAILGCNVGFSATMTEDCSSIASDGAYYTNGSGNVSITLLIGTQTANSIGANEIYGAKLIDSSTSDDDSGPLVDSIGNIMSNMAYTIDFPYLEGDNIYLTGSLTLGGSIQTFELIEEGGVFTVSAVDEPNTLLLFIVVLIILFCIKVKTYIISRNN